MVEIRDIREKGGWTQVQLAHRARIDRGRLAAIEGRYALPREEESEAIKRAFIELAKERVADVTVGILSGNLDFRTRQHRR
jgi:transcriptional regulator with XRE-family HTH domain